MSLGLTLSQTQKLALTPQLQHALKILQMPSEDLRLAVVQALQENPFLEVDESASEEEAFSLDAPKEELSWEANSEGEGDLWDVAETQKSLWAYLLEQLGCLDLSAEEQMRVQWLIGSLDEQGFLTESLEEISSQYPISEEFNPNNWTKALQTLQSFDPTGVGASSARECLLLQLKNVKANKEAIELATDIVKNYFEDFAHKKFDLLLKSLGCSPEELREAEVLIRSLNPHPAAEYSQVQITYAVPEAEAYKTNGSWKVRLLQDRCPQIKINDAYASALSSLETEEDSQLWHGRLVEARQLVKSIRQRQETLLRVCSLIVRKQKEFFNQGPEKMKPMVLREIAEELEMHESTVSRVTRGKYLASPQGIFELRYFFSASVPSSTEDEAISATAAKAELKKILDEENARKPFSDEKLSQILENKGIKIARRTVAKYREALGFPSASLRKRL